VHKRAQRESWQELRRLCQLEVDRTVDNQVDPAGGEEAARFNLESFQAAREGIARVREMLGQDRTPRELRDLAQALHAFLQAGRLAVGQPTENIAADFTKALLEAFRRRKKEEPAGLWG